MCDAERPYAGENFHIYTAAGRCFLRGDTQFHIPHFRFRVHAELGEEGRPICLSAYGLKHFGEHAVCFCGVSPIFHVCSPYGLDFSDFYFVIHDHSSLFFVIAIHT